MRKFLLFLLQLLLLVRFSFENCETIWGSSNSVIKKWWYSYERFPMICYSITNCFNVSTIFFPNDTYDHSDCFKVSDSNISIVPSIGNRNRFKGVNLDGNCINAFENAFEGLPELEELSISNNNITTLPKELFTLNKYLKIVDLSYNTINGIRNNTFPDSIEYLNLMHNKLQKLDYFLPSSLINLEISFNMISYILETTFLKTTKLNTLNLSNNLLTTLSPLLFTSSKTLLELNLSYNDISVLHADTFKYLHLMELLKLSNNALKALNFTLPESLTYIDLSFNSLLVVEKNSFFGTTKLRKINLINNLLKTLPTGLFDQLKDFTTILLQYNNITSLPKSLFACNSNLQYLSLQYNRLQSLNITLPSSLIDIDLSFNLISSIEANSFYKLNFLRELMLNNNLLQNLPIGCFLSLNHLKFLNLSNNNVNMTYGTFGGLINLETLLIINNSITDLPELVLGDMKKLTSLDVSNNFLSTLEVTNIAKHLRHLRSVRLEGNRFKCSYLMELIAQFKSSEVEVEAAEQFFESNVRGIGCVHDGQKFTFTDEDATESQGSTSNNIADTKQFIREVMSGFKAIFADERKQLQYTIQEINSNYENNKFNSASKFSSGQLNLSEKLNGMDYKMDGLAKNYMIIFQTIILFAVFVIISFKLYAKFRRSRRVISLTEMNNLHYMDH